MPTLFEDKYAIEERVGIYNLSLDQGNYEEFLSCWCEDGTFDGLAGMGGPFILFSSVDPAPSPINVELARV